MQISTSRSKVSRARLRNVAASSLPAALVDVSFMSFFLRTLAPLVTLSSAWASRLNETRHESRLSQMRRLMLLRHAKTETDSPSGRDRDRRLDERGRRDAAEIGNW